MTETNLGALPPDINEPPPGAKGWLAFQPSSSKVWWKINGEWLPIDEALKCSLLSLSPNCRRVWWLRLGMPRRGGCWGEG